MALKRLARNALRPTKRRRARNSAAFGSSHVKQAPGFSPDHFHPAKPKPVLSDPPRQATAELLLAPSDLVIGLCEADEARAYPIDGLAIHHLVNDTLVSPTLVTFCARCFSGVAFDPVVAGERLMFNVAGMYEGNMAMTDLQTGTLWSQMSGEALAGPMVGHQLEMQRGQTIAVGNWLDLYPDSESPHATSLEVGEHRVPGRLTGGAHMRVSHSDDRLTPETLVLGVDIPGAPTAFVLESEDLHSSFGQAEVAGVPVALLAAPGGWPMAFDRRVDGETVDLRTDVLAGDRSVWNHEGQATGGPHEGQSLEFIPSRTVHWYAWVAAHPDTEIESFPSD